MTQSSSDVRSRQVAERVNAELRRKGLSKSALARRMQRHHQWLNRRLWGQVSFSVDELQEAADALEVPVSELMGEEEV
jgi:transcriptional regulator with XRE-family HTH domain